MTRQKFFSLFLAVSLIFCPLSLAEELTLTTYYPAPFGAYDRIRLVPRESLSADEHCRREKDLGVMYYDNGLEDKAEGIYVCQKISEGKFDWVLVSRSAYGEPNVVQKQHVVCMKPGGQLGVCVNNPSYDGTCACH